jgi:hypothetical protein
LFNEVAFIIVMCYAIVVTWAENVFEFTNSHIGGIATKAEYYRPNGDGTGVWMFSYLQRDASDIVRRSYGGSNKEGEQLLFEAEFSNDGLVAPLHGYYPAFMY